MMQPVLEFDPTLANLGEPSEPVALTEFEPEGEEIPAFLPEDSLGRIPPFPNPFRHPIRASIWLVTTVFGLISLVVLLAVIAAIPLVNFLALGYLLEAQGRLGRTGRFRYAFPLLDLAPRLGSMALGLWLWLIPLRLMSSAAADARLIAPGSGAAVGWNVATIVAAVLVGLHLALALARGGGFWCFFRPIRNVRWLVSQLRSGGYWGRAEAAVRKFVADLRLRHHFVLGLKGFAGAFVWLLIPSALFGTLQDTSKPGQVLLTLAGGFLLVLVLSWVPFLQARFATENRLRAAFELRSVRTLFKRAPLAWLVATVVTYTLSLPLYLFKIALPPEDAMWGVTLVFIATIYPAKVMTGWAYHRALRKTQPAWFVWRGLSLLLLFPLLGFYVFLLFFTPAIGEHGKRILFEHHALLLPVPF